MGNFTDNIRHMDARRPVNKTAKEVVATHTGKNMAIDAYFVRIKKAWFKFWKHDVFVHYKGEDKENVEYRLEPGTTGACIFRKEDAKAFIAELKATNLEMVPFHKIVKTGG